MTAVPEQRIMTLEQAQSALTDISESERHFNQLGSQYRLLASTWLLAALGAIGYVLTAEHLVVPAINIIVLITLAGSAGILLLWVIDLLVYHRLLDANFLEGLRIESRFDELPQVRYAMWQQFSTGFGVTTLVRVYYCGCALAPLCAGIFIALTARLVTPLLTMTIVTGDLVILAVIALLWIKSENKWLAENVRRISQSHLTRT
jgi:hypothetical protein